MPNPTFNSGFYTNSQGKIVDYYSGADPGYVKKKRGGGGGEIQKWGGCLILPENSPKITYNRLNLHDLSVKRGGGALPIRTPAINYFTK